MVYGLAIFAAFVLLVWALASASNRAIRNAALYGARPDPRIGSGQSYEAGSLLTEAESLYMQGRTAEAAGVFRQVLSMTEGAGDSLSASEALYGLARIATRNHEHGQAVAYLERALRHADGWRAEKPMFEQLLHHELAEARLRTA